MNRQEIIDFISRRGNVDNELSLLDSSTKYQFVAMEDVDVLSAFDD